MDLGSNLLAALREQDLARIEPHLQPLKLSAGDVIYDPGDEVRHAYFPLGSAMASFLIPMKEGETVETAMVGREGVVGGIVSNGLLPAYAKCSVMHGGDFLRLPSIVLDEAKRQSVHMGNLFARYADCLVAQIFQSVACNALHSIEQRAAKWLLFALDRTGRDELVLTQQQLGSLLGIGRSYVTRVVARMKASGVIEIGRGRVRILDRHRLAYLSCDCNLLVAEHFDIVLRGVYPDGA
ncbi:Crp/Fnr family transcriptional regulator [Sphingobium sp. DEHP117]|uniref:Crp/Fnr family transcriptional regulator n=1 Tax=Sphingobium sp. DEHP117 TaxID=2993436 RepID=UPI0027D53A29|nr:helix-turn-helix domain-containing protein [Sphingobium sp. DEHP117]MDQ4421847.1 Crp/Fnr family transcriptional regulator [Sphingobium sp. DEHP117]